VEQESEVENELKLALEEACLELGVTLSTAFSPSVSLASHHTSGLCFFYMCCHECILSYYEACSEAFGVIVMLIQAFCDVV
jgi:hypothetical protein